MVKISVFELKKLKQSMLTWIIIIAMLYPLIWGVILDSHPKWLEVEGKVDVFTFMIMMLQLFFTFKLHYLFVILVYAQFTSYLAGGQIIYEVVRFPNRIKSMGVKMGILMLTTAVFLVVFNIISYLSFEWFVKGSDFYSASDVKKTDVNAIIVQSIAIFCYFAVLIVFMMLISQYIKSFVSVIIVIALTNDLMY